MPTRRFALVLLTIAVLGLAGLAIAARDDLAVAGFFYAGHGRFVGQTPLGQVGRDIARSLPFLLTGIFILAYILGRAGVLDRRFAPSHRGIVFVALSMALGVGLFVNAFLKEVSHRPRPINIEAFEGRSTFRPFWRFDGDCRHNCSFPSGEAASSFWTTAPALLTPPPWRAAAVGAALAFGLGASALRLAFGGHFLSDVTFSAAAILLVNLILYRWIMRRRP